MVENERIRLASNWGTLGDANLLSVLIGSNSDDAEISLDDITANNCVCLVNKDSRIYSKAHMEIQVDGYIKNIILVSEAQVIEVFGVNDEYLLTHNAEFFDDWEGMAVYYTTISVPSIPICKLKFTRIKNKDRVWIYGAKIHTQRKVNHHIESRTNFNFDQINRLLGNPNLHNINSSNGFKNLLQLYFKNLSNNSSRYLSGKKPLQNDNNTNTPNCIKNESNQENGLTEILSRLEVSEPSSVEFQKTSSKPISGSNYWLTTYIDRKFNEIKTEILHELDTKLNNYREETNHKLDKIISLLVSEKAEGEEVK